MEECLFCHTVILQRWHFSKYFYHRPNIGIIERGVPQAYVRARASSATLCSVHVLRVSLSLCIFDIKRESDMYQMGSYTYLIRIQTRTPLSRYPPYDYSKNIAAQKQNMSFHRDDLPGGWPRLRLGERQVM